MSLAAQLAPVIRRDAAGSAPSPLASLGSTGPAFPSALGVHVKVAAVIWMASWTARFEGIKPREAPAAAPVLVRSDDFQMRGVHAAPIAAQMVEFQALRDGADKQRVGQPVSRHNSTLVTDMPVTIGRGGPLPDPAGILGDFNTGKQTPQWISEDPEWRTRERISMHTPSVVVLTTEAPSMSRVRTQGYGTDTLDVGHAGPPRGSRGTRTARLLRGPRYCRPRGRRCR